jgi:hypothetical protein
VEPVAAEPVAAAPVVPEQPVAEPLAAPVEPVPVAAPVVERSPREQEEDRELSRCLLRVVIG